MVSTDWLYLCLSSVLYASTLVLSTTSTPVQSGPNTISCFSTSSSVLLHVCGLPSSRISTVGIYSKTDSRKSVPDITQETCDPKYIEILESTTEYTEQKCPKQQYSSSRYQVVPLLPWLCDTNSRESAGEAATARTSQLKKLTSSSNRKRFDVPICKQLPTGSSVMLTTKKSPPPFNVYYPCSCQPLQPSGPTFTR